MEKSNPRLTKLLFQNLSYDKWSKPAFLNRRVVADFKRVVGLVQNDYYSYMYVVKAAETTFIQKICTLNIDEIDTSSKFNMSSELMSMRMRVFMIADYRNCGKQDFKTT